MDNETMNLLQTVCAAGGARSSFHGDSNARLEQLVEDGLLDVSNLPNSRRRLYRPTKKGVTMVQRLAVIDTSGLPRVG